MEQTQHYQLKKPGENDYADVAVLNGNAELIDRALHGLSMGKADLDEDGKIPAGQLPLGGDIDCGTF